MCKSYFSKHGSKEAIVGDEVVTQKRSLQQTANINTIFLNSYKALHEVPIGLLQ